MHEEAHLAQPACLPACLPEELGSVPYRISLAPFPTAGESSAEG